MAKIYILGNGGFAQEIFEQVILGHAVKEEFGGFIILKDGEAILIGDEGAVAFSYPEDARFILGTGNKYWRRRFLSHFTTHYQKTLQHFPNIEAPTSWVSKIAKMGVGNVFMGFSMVNANCEMGNFNNFNTHSSIHHDCVIGDNNVLSPYSGLMGYVVIEDENFLGVGTHITPKCKVGNENTLSAGETLFDNMEDRQFFQHGIVLDKP